MMILLRKLISKYYKHLLFREIGYELKRSTVYGRIFVLNKNLRIEEGIHLYPNVTFMGDGEIKIGKNVKIGNNVCIGAFKGGGVVIGDNTIIAANCYIIDSNHGYKKDICIAEQALVTERVIIGHDVWLGNDVSVLKGSVIESGVVVAAKSLVNSHLQGNKVCWGIPAREMKDRE